MTNSPSPAGRPPTVTFQRLFGSPAYSRSAAHSRGRASLNAGATSTASFHRGPRWNRKQTAEDGVM